MEFRIYYSYDIKDGDEMVRWKRDTFTVEADSPKSLDTVYIKERIVKIADDACIDPRWKVTYANYYKIEEIGDCE